MNALGRLMNVGVAMTGIGLSACGNDNASDAAAPAHVEHAVTEAELTRISLTAEAVARLGLETAIVERRTVAMTRILGGELLVPPGHVMTVAAPTAGIVLGPQREAMLPAGAKLEGGDVVMELLPLPPDGELLAAREDIAVRESELNVARARAERAAQLLPAAPAVKSNSRRRSRSSCGPKLRCGSHARSNRCYSAPTRAA